MLRQFDTRNKIKVNQQADSENEKVMIDNYAHKQLNSENQKISDHNYVYDQPEIICKFDNSTIIQKNTEEYKLSISNKQEELFKLKATIDKNIQDLNNKLQEIDNN